MKKKYKEIRYINIDDDNFIIWTKDYKDKIKEKKYKKKKKEKLVDFIDATKHFEKDFDKEK